MSYYRLAVLLLVPVLSGCGADVSSTLDSGQAIAQPVIDALERYENENESYPGTLDELVENRLLETIPELPTVSGTLDVKQLRYMASPDKAFYMLTFAYDFPDFLGPANLTTRYYTSFDRTWNTRRYPPSFNSIVADRAGESFRDGGSYESLRTAVDAMIRAKDLGSGCVNLYELSVNERLGKGDKFELPADMAEDGDEKVVQYRPKAPDVKSFVFVYKTKSIMALDKQNDKLSPRNFMVARAVYVATEGGGLRLFAKCR